MDGMTTEETKLANGGGAFPMWVSLTVVAGALAVLFALFYGITWLFG